MALKSFKPYTKSTRGTVLIDRTNLWKGNPFKPLTSVNNSSKGRNNLGRITSRNHGGGHKQKYRNIDFYRRKFNSMGEIQRIEYDPNRSCHIMLVKFDDGKQFYYLAPQKIKVGDKIQNGSNIEIKIGKAGRSRWLGIRPHTTGVVKNPVDHPHGGGEGKSAGGRHPVSPTGQSAKGLKTRDNKRTDKFIIRRRKKKRA